jgi:Flp pilus assembly protein TadG
MHSPIITQEREHLPSVSRQRSRQSQQGALAVEFALSFYAFILLMMLTVWAGVYGYQYAAANIATELGARAAAVCYDESVDPAAFAASARVKAVAAMSPWIPVTTSDIAVKKLPDNCVGTACISVQVTFLQSYTRSQGAPFNVASLGFPSSVAVTKRLELPSSSCSPAASAFPISVAVVGRLKPFLSPRS